MPLRPVSLAFLACLATTCALTAPPAQGQAGQPPQRDPQAVAIAQRALAALGAGNLAIIRDTVAQGTVSFVGDDHPDKGTVTFKTLGLGQVRGDYQLSGGATSVVYNAGRGAERDPDGSVAKYWPGHTVYKRADHLPIFSMLAEYALLNVGVRLVGEEVMSGAKTWHIEIVRYLTTQEDPTKLYAPLAKCQVWVDQATNLVSKISYLVPAAKNLSDQYPMDFVYADYRSEAGLAVPRTITQSVAGHEVAVYQITSFAVNTGARDTDFELPR